MQARLYGSVKDIVLTSIRISPMVLGNDSITLQNIVSSGKVTLHSPIDVLYAKS